MTEQQPSCLSGQTVRSEQNPMSRVDQFSADLTRIRLPIIATIVVALATTTSVCIAVAAAFLLAPMFNVQPEDMSVGHIVTVTCLTTFFVAAPVVMRGLVWLRRLARTKKQLDAALQDATALAEAKSAFVAIISHEIRTPLNGILGMARSLENAPLGDREHEMAATIADSGKTMLAILNDILDISKMEAGKLEITPAEGDLVSEVMQVKQLFAASAEEKGVSLVFDAAPGIPETLRFDPVRIRQCISNLVANGIKFTDHGQVSVSIETKLIGEVSHLVTITVSDTGAGIAEDVQETLFADYAQGDTAGSGRYGGTGLGLAISRKLARKMNGDITLRSAPGRGSTFAMTFLAQAVAMRSAKPLPTEHRGGVGPIKGTRILLTDDIAINRKVAKLFLEPLEVDVAEAENGREALERLECEDFDLLLLDVHMPVLDGWETLRRVRASDRAWRDLPVIALTADNVAGREEEFLNFGFSGVVPKPIDEQLLMREIQNALSGRSWPRAGAVA